jgi:hypothetical protein
MKRTFLFLLVIGVILLPSSLFSSGQAGAPPGLQVTITPTAFNYLPFVAKSWLYSFKPLSEDSVLMLIGELWEEGPPTPWLSALEQRIDLAVQSGVDTVEIVFRTSAVEYTFQELDQLLNRAAQKGIGVIPRIVVNSQTFSELIRTESDLLPDYTNAAQFQYAVELLERVIRHLEAFPNIVAYQVEWGHYGESWINAPFWDSPSSKNTFLTFLKSLSPEFYRFDVNNIANWANGDVMYYCPFLPEGDPRRDHLNVAEFCWYQQWRNRTTREITWELREAVKGMTQKPIVGFSYVVAGPGYEYTAHSYLDATFSDWVPHPLSAHKDFIRDAYFAGLHLGELDFDTPYFAKENVEQAIANMYGRGIVPVIFYPHWSEKLFDGDIPELVQYINKYKGRISEVDRAQVLIVFGRSDIGIINTNSVEVLPEGGLPLTWDDPPGLLAAMLSKGVSVDAINPEVYTPSLGDRYKVVLVVVPRDSIDHEFQDRLSQTSTNIFVAHPSFLFGTPTTSSPLTTTSGYCGNWNPVILQRRSIGIQVWGIAPGVQNPRVEFRGPLSQLGTITNYTPNHVFSYYQGDFDEIYATAHFLNASFPTIVRIGNIVLFGLDTHVTDEVQRQISQSAFLKILEGMGVRLD